MIGNICLLLEILSVIFCLHNLYGEKVKFDIVTTSFLVVYMILMSTINYYKLPQFYSLLIYPLIIIYSGIKFEFKIKELIINNILYMVIIGGIQLVVGVIYGSIFRILSFDNLFLRNRELLIVNSIVLIIVILIFPKLKLNRLSIYLQDKERILIVSIVFCILFTVFSFTNYKVFNGLEVYRYLEIFFFLSLCCILAGKLGKYKIKSKEIETELKLNRLYADSFHSLIDDIRSRQHEFDNHINAIYSLHYTCNSYEKLVAAQNEYSQTIIKENRFNKLLKVGNPLLIGFLYGKLLEAEKQGINVTFQISIEDLSIGIPVYKIVEVIGNLINNSIEAMSDLACPKKLHIVVIENKEMFEIEVRNRSKFIEYEKVNVFFKKGYSKKGKNRGWGLYNVKNICDEYMLNIYFENKNIDEENWVSFTICSNKKEAI